MIAKILATYFSQIIVMIYSQNNTDDTYCLHFKIELLSQIKCLMLGACPIQCSLMKNAISIIASEK